MMDITKYSKKTWIAVLVLAVVSIAVDILILTNVLGGSDETMQSTSRVSLVIGALALFYGIKGVAYHIKKDKETR